MFKYIKSAEEDYVKIGNIVLPKDASKYDYNTSYDQIVKDTRRKYDAEQSEKAQAAEKQRMIELGKGQYNEVKQAVQGQDLKSDDVLTKLHDILVPSSGKAESTAGELIRALMRLQYRWLNDGDYFFKGYGLKTAGPSAAYIADTAKGQASVLIQTTTENGHEYLYDDDEYEQFLVNLQVDVINYILDNPYLFGETSVDSRDYYSNTLYDIVNLDSMNSFDVDVSRFYNLVNDDIMSWNDVRQFLYNLTTSYGGSVETLALDAFEITDLSSEELQAWEEYYDMEADSFAEEYESEYTEDYE